MELCLKILDGDRKTRAVGRGVDEVNLVYSQEYTPGTRIILETSGEAEWVWLQVDDALGRSLVYITGSDQHEIQNCYPHASANVETRGESVFAAQNAIDGITVNTCHGEWPYQSWGINMQEDARIRIDFGRTVEIDRIILYTRADFPHDNWWKSVNFAFSDGSGLEMKMEKSTLPHEIVFPAKQVCWLEMNQMKKSEEPSPFPALTQIEVYGTECFCEEQPGTPDQGAACNETGEGIRK